MCHPRIPTRYAISIEWSTALHIATQDCSNQCRWEVYPFYNYLVLWAHVYSDRTTDNAALCGAVKHQRVFDVVCSLCLVHDILLAGDLGTHAVYSLLESDVIDTQSMRCYS
jgi:hypothetical protein